MKKPTDRKIKRYFRLEDIKFFEDKKEWRDQCTGYVTITMRSETFRDLFYQVLKLQHIFSDKDTLKLHFYWDEMNKIIEKISNKRIEFLRQKYKKHVAKN